MIHLSEEAANEVQRLKKKEKLGEFYLRCGVQGGGCSGLSYTLGFDKEKNEETDHEFEQHGVKILVDNKSHLYLDGASLEFSKELLGGGFKFLNPNAKTTCGCGESFS